MRRKQKIQYPKERVILSDVLPYEIPLIFSNRYFFKVIQKRNKALIDENFKKDKVKAFKEIESILFNTGSVNQPFRFKIKHKENEFRELNLIHPKNQLAVSDFYEKYNSLIIYYSSVSPFSIRKPSKIASFTFYNDILHKKNNDNSFEYSQIEEDGNEYENLKSYFTYYKYSNIHKFYESYQFHRCEKKYKNLLKIDIAKCFDSIYTHTISWALFNKPIIKDNIDNSHGTFSGLFDKLMQTLNANETNGIVIGPEFSRIFAEIILQQIDKDILNNLQGNDCTKKLFHKRDYEIFRYVDDYFIFFNDEEDKEMILKEFKLCLKEYKLYLNDSKSAIYSKPIITEISIAKQKISDLFNETLFLKENKEDDEIKSIYFSSNNVITRFKTIIKESKVDYKDIMNYSLAVLDNKTLNLTKKWKSLDDKNEKHQRHFEKGFLEILDVAFFLYSVAPRVNSTIKISLIIDKIVSFLKKNKSNDYTEPFISAYKHNIFKKISDEIFQTLQKYRADSTTQVECLYLLIALNQLGREYRLSVKNLCSYFNIDYHNGKVIIKNDLNYFSITVLLFYIKDIKIYSEIKDALKLYILKKFEDKQVFNWKSDTELVLLLLDIISCPFLNEDSAWQKKKIRTKKDEGKSSRELKRYKLEEKNTRYKYKKSILSLLGITDNHIELIESEKYWFIKWTNFDFGMELQAKRSQEVY
jgi:hypothetical protein